MKRLPLILSATALVISFLGATSVGRATIDSVVPFAKNAGAVNGIKASKRPISGRLVPLAANGKFPASVGQAGAAGPAGPAGAAGPQGAKGDTGAAGTAGAAGATSAVMRLGTSVSVPSGQIGSASVACHAGERATGGGFFNQGGVVEASRPSPLSDGAAATGWQVSVSNTTGAAEFIGAYAICVSP